MYLTVQERMQLEKTLCNLLISKESAEKDGVINTLDISRMTDDELEKAVTLAIAIA